jgi:endonuclease/exonuclease/phosphatase family metal-dependent hydrolase
MKRARSLVCLAVMAALVLVIPAASAQASGLPASVMTRNLYLGADLTPALAATSVPALLGGNAAIWGNVQATNFPARAKALAREIALLRPDLVGLQEVAMWRTGPITPAPPFVPNATNVVYDFLDSLTDELAALHADYEVAVVQEEADLQAPSALGIDIRLTQRDVILVRDTRSVSYANPQKAHYATQLVIPLLGNPALAVTSRRGWTSVDATVRGNAFRFVNTHLEAFHPIIRDVQAQQLLSGPAGGAGPTVLVGDLNDDPATPGPYNAYNEATTAGFDDAAVQAGHPRPTCCHGELLDDATAAFDSRIDHVLSKGLDRPALLTTVTGDEQINRVPAFSGLWPSDHGGVFAILRP